MPKPAHCRVTYEGVVGTVAAPIERWSFNVNYPVATLALTDTDAVADGFASALAAGYAATLKNGMPEDVILTRIKVSHVQDDGKVALRADGTYVQGEWNGSHAGPLAKQPMPLQTALCVSLVTGRAGPTGKGRYFSPWPAISPDSTTKLLTVADTADKASQHAAFLDDAATRLGQPPMVVSSKGYSTEVVAVRVGRAPDTMRSRREDIPEGYSTVPLA